MPAQPTLSKPEDYFFQLLRIGIESRASDVHLKSGEMPWVRVDGRMTREAEFHPVSSSEMDAIVSFLCSNDGFDRRPELQETGNVDLSYQQERRRFRVNISKVYGASDASGQQYQVTARILPSFIPSVDKLGFPNESYREILSLERGLVLVTGVTGSGKSTTLASIIEAINAAQEKSIITLEQPVEYLLESNRSYIRQREIPLSTSSFANGVREAMRQDPDVIMIGEIRDYQTAEAALQAAETGHLVFATLHTKSATESISRMASLCPTEMEVKLRYDLASNLEFVLSQQLIPRREGQGRALAMEIFRPGEQQAARQFIRKGEEQNQLMSFLQTNKRSGNTPMDDSLYQLVHHGIITSEKAKQYAHKPGEMADRLLKLGP